MLTMDVNPKRINFRVKNGFESMRWFWWNYRW
jgi:hypothetical protein